MKDKIVRCAHGVFNQKGIRNTTLRDIAQQVPISDGHLRYYFNTKEALIMALFAQMDQEIGSFVHPGLLTRPTAGSLVETLTKSFAVMEDYGFFFTESPALLAQYPRLSDAYQQLIANRRELLLSVFEGYRRVGIFRQDRDAVLYKVLFEQFFLVTDNWVKYARLPGDKPASKSDLITNYVAVSLALLLPYFTDPLRSELTDWVIRVCA